MQSGFWVVPKITSANLCKQIHYMINYSIFICPFEFGKCGKGKKEEKNIENEKKFLDKKQLAF